MLLNIKKETRARITNYMEKYSIIINLTAERSLEGKDLVIYVNVHLLNMQWETGESGDMEQAIRQCGKWGYELGVKTRE